MRTFELAFKWECPVAPPDSEYAKKNTTWFRVIQADNQELARAIGNAMVGEELYAGEYIGRLISVAEVDVLPEYAGFWDDGTLAWRRVLCALHLVDEEVEFVFDASGQKVGFRLTS